MNVGKQQSFDFKANTICQDFVYLQMKSSKLLMLKPGEWIHPEIFEKLQTLQKSLIIESVVDLNLKEKFKTLITNHQKTKFENDILKSANELILSFEKSIFTGASFYNWAQSCFEVFSKIDAEQISAMYDIDVKIVKKAYLTSAISVWVSCVNGYSHPDFLQDIYHLSFFQDVGLVTEEYSYFVMEAIEKERASLGSGFHYLLKMKASGGEISLFRNHPRKSFEFLVKLDVLNNKNLAQSLLTQHEMCDGEGFLGYTGITLSSWEQIIILSDQLVSYASLDHFDVVTSLENFKQTDISNIPVDKVIKKVLSCFNHSLLKESA